MSDSLAYRGSGFGILYAEDFEAAPPPPPPAASDAAEVAVWDAQPIEAARQDGYEAGLAAGQAAASADHQRQIALAVAAISSRLDGAAGRHADQQSQLARSLVELTMAALSAALPALMRNHGAAESAAAVNAILPAIEPGWKLEIGAPTESLAELRTLIDGRGIDLCWRPDESLRPGDIEIAWRDGGFSRDGRAIIAAILQSLALPHALGTPAFMEHANDARV